MKRFSVLVVDDEPLAREGLQMLLSGDPQVVSISEAKNGREAVTAIRESRPDLVFLDVQMPEMDGFHVVEEVGPEQMPAVVFVTAHDQYAIRAFEINALDYLLKPVSAERFHQSLERAKARLSGGEEVGRRMVSMLEAMANPSPYAKRLAARSGTRTLFVPVDDIEWIQAAENYVELHCDAGCHLLLATMNMIEASLDRRPDQGASAGRAWRVCDCAAERCSAPIRPKLSREAESARIESILTNGSRPVPRVGQ
jgi:two-component system LytT family response regulator